MPVADTRTLTFFSELHDFHATTSMKNKRLDKNTYI